MRRTLTGAAAALTDTANVGGGTWNHDAYVSWAVNHVYSNYYHNTVRHSGTSVCGSNNVTSVQAAHVWANSATTCGPFAHTVVYWNNQVG